MYLHCTRPSRINRQGYAVLQQVNKPVLLRMNVQYPYFKNLQEEFPESPQFDCNVVVKEYFNLFRTIPNK